ncbi:hypothetical protein [Actinoplanes couchii]|uniref:Transcriptional regulator n=1 Tax=Actinoplanes couchii TaxID=403638 RepID=A0ABQ3XTF1_9ACTN|nr:hypothetical protein [Actinoplanes couchii]MDR6318952.1 hypothetical protein [Actinoplanes couchii]GID61799.1 hypothetical protein Aco03nite_102030 [Actinoplanes couchii]
MRRRTLLTSVGAAALTTLASTSASAVPVPSGPRFERLLLAPTTPAVPLTLQQAGIEVAAVSRAYSNARFAAVAANLPSLLSRLHATVTATTGHARDTATALLSRAYQVASNAATKHGDDAIALTMADRGRTHATTSGDHLVLTAATHILAITMRRDGHHAAALDLLTGTAQELHISGSDPMILAAYGNLLCTAAYTAAQTGNASDADTYLQEVVTTAARIDGHRTLASELPFGATAAVMYQISVHTALGNTGTALKHAASINPAAIPTQERLGRYLVDTARAWSRHGNADKAANAVLAAYRHSPEEVDRTSVRELVATLLYSPTPTPAALRRLASNIGVH